VAEVKTGERVQLDWALNKFDNPGFGRKKFEHKIIDLGSISAEGVEVVGHDDEVRTLQITVDTT
jgi:hypothetical protein